MEEKRPDALEVAAKAYEEREKEESNQSWKVVKLRVLYRWMVAGSR